MQINIAASIGDAIGKKPKPLHWSAMTHFDTALSYHAQHDFENALLHYDLALRENPADFQQPGHCLAKAAPL
jgi:hypothetical protein